MCCDVHIRTPLYRRGGGHAASTLLPYRVSALLPCMLSALLPCTGVCIAAMHSVCIAALHGVCIAAIHGVMHVTSARLLQAVQQEQGIRDVLTRFLSQAEYTSFEDVAGHFDAVRSLLGGRGRREGSDFTRGGGVHILSGAR